MDPGYSAGIYLIISVLPQKYKHPSNDRYSTRCSLHQDMFVALHGWGFTLFALPVGVLYGLYSYVMTLKRSYDTWRSETHEEVASVESGEVEDQEAVTGQGANPPPAAASLSTFLSSRQCPTWLMAAQFAWGYTAEVVLIFFALYLYQDGGDSKVCRHFSIPPYVCPCCFPFVFHQDNSSHFLSHLALRPSRVRDCGRFYAVISLLGTGLYLGPLAN